MSDEELAREIGTALRERYPLPTGVNILPRLQDQADGPRWRTRSILAAAAIVVLVAALSAVLARQSTTTSRPGSASGITGKTWTDPASHGTVVFNEDSVNIFDLCHNGLRALTIGDSSLTIGKSIGRQSTCGGTPGWPPPDVAHFDRVLAAGRVTWALDGDTLRLTNADGDALELHATGPALAVTGQKWALERVSDAGSELSGSFGSALLTIEHGGAVHADDLCTDLSGSATVTDTAISFADMQAVKPCIDPGFTPATRVIDSVLSGTITYVIRGDELILYGRTADLLIYTPSG
jgi:heat shock protein HslJ